MERLKLQARVPPAARWNWTVETACVQVPVQRVSPGLIRCCWTARAEAEAASWAADAPLRKAPPLAGDGPVAAEAAVAGAAPAAISEPAATALTSAAVILALTEEDT
ncbi:hypothetical protein GCM10020229_39270 [Kitasatospora albolonga]